MLSLCPNQGYKSGCLGQWPKISIRFDKIYAIGHRVFWILTATFFIWWVFRCYELRINLKSVTNYIMNLSWTRTIHSSYRMSWWCQNTQQRPVIQGPWISAVKGYFLLNYSNAGFHGTFTRLFTQIFLGNSIILCINWISKRISTSI